MDTMESAEYHDFISYFLFYGMVSKKAAQNVTKYVNETCAAFDSSFSQEQNTKTKYVLKTS